MAEKIEKKKNQISALFSTQRPLGDWPDGLDHLAIGLVANLYTKLEKSKWKFVISSGVVLYENHTV